MKNSSIFLIILLISGVAYAFPQFRDGFQIYCDGEMLEAGYNASPLVYDWNQDGLNDLVVACLEEIDSVKVGTIQFYPNSGTNTNPVFTGFTRIMADGEDIHTEGHC
ncbi:MAG: hypothetical protein KAS73_04905 [Candidatus Sabulitectum sp.]|nr:hypothetical protein [Candidatus Sabulitectum sp.]